MPHTPGSTPAATRREFLRTSATALGAALALPLGITAAGCATSAASSTSTPTSTTAGASMASAPGASSTAMAGGAMPAGTRVPGIQLYTVRSIMQSDMDGTLAALAKMGYKEFEFAGYFGRDPHALRTMLDGLGVTAPSAHIPLETLRTAIGPALDAAAVLGHQYIVCPYIVDRDRTPEGFARIADDLSRIGAETKARGMQLAYHNHDFEFKPMPNGQLPYDMILARTDPSLVKMEVDLYWITYAGQDPLKYIAAHPGRFPLCHVKDLQRTAAGAQEMADVGQGTIDFRTIFLHGEQAGFKHYFVERDDAKDPLASARASERALQALLA